MPPQIPHAGPRTGPTLRVGGWVPRAVGAVVAGLLLWLAFPEHDLWWLAPVAVALLAAVTLDVGGRRGFALGMLAGWAFFVPVLSWSGVYVGKLPWFALATLQALYVALMCAVVGFVGRCLRPRWGDSTYAVVPLAWVVQELARGTTPFGGFPWARLAFSQADSPLANVAQWLGAPGVTFAVAVVGTALLAGVASARRHPRTAGVALAGGAAVLVLSGLATPQVTGRQVTVGLVQGNVPRAGLDFNAERRAVLDNHVRGTELIGERLATDPPENLPAPLSLVVWPENSSDIDPIRNADAAAQVQRAVTAVGVPVIVGAVLQEPDPDLSNASLLYRPGGAEPERYVKNHPVPFAEYIPYRSFFRTFSDKVDLVTRDFVSGEGLGAFRIDATSGAYWALPTICFEVAYDGLMRDSVTQPGKEAGLILVQTNNATFGYTAESEQQFAISRIRAIEHGRSVAHVSTVGVSGFVAPDGSVTGKTGLFTAEQPVAPVTIRTERTLSDRLGVWPEWVAVAALVLLVGGAGVARRGVRVGRPDPERPTKDHVD
ncbi:apolipoprotein N-acyltransferase [Knoellia aerolata]|uniref:apolipoprotein N-acyltransferase n=1 Tax=Knoellia aerolata TaxID=442954 RepID=UPI001FE02568|nr:apolipoprotein N-acyltransferase [Knoellia aerolata]